MEETSSTTASPRSALVMTTRDWIMMGVGLSMTLITFILLSIVCAYNARGSCCWEARVKLGECCCGRKKKRKKDEGEKKDRPPSAQSTPSTRPALAIDGANSISKSNSNSINSRNSTPMASPAAPAPTVPPVPPAYPVPAQIEILDVASGKVGKAVTAVQLAAAIEGGLDRPQKDDESVDDVLTDWGNTQTLKTVEEEKSGVSRGSRGTEVSCVTKTLTTEAKK